MSRVHGLYFDQKKHKKHFQRKTKAWWGNKSTKKHFVLLKTLSMKPPTLLGEVRDLWTRFTRILDQLHDSMSKEKYSFEVLVNFICLGGKTNVVTVSNRDPDSNSDHHIFYVHSARQGFFMPFLPKKLDKIFIIWLHSVSYIVDINKFEPRILLEPN